MSKIFTMTKMPTLRYIMFQAGRADWSAGGEREKLGGDDPDDGQRAHSQTAGHRDA